MEYWKMDKNIFFVNKIFWSQNNRFDLAVCLLYQHWIDSVQQLIAGPRLSTTLKWKTLKTLKLCMKSSEQPVQLNNEQIKSN